MRILLITPSLDTGGAQRSAAYLTRALARRHDVTLFLFEGDAIAYDAGCEVVVGPAVSGRRPQDKVARFVARARSVRSLKRARGFDVAVSFLEGADYVNLASRCGERCVLSVRGSKVHDQNIAGPLGVLRRRVLIPSALAAADAVVALSHGVAHELVDVFHVRPPEKIHVIHNFIDTDAVRASATAPLDPHLRLWCEDPYIVAHARLEPEKGLVNLVPVMAALQHRDGGPGLGLLLVGDGSEAESIAQQARRCGLELALRPYDTLAPRTQGGPQVVITGARSNPMPFVARARAFAMPSTHEGFGNSLLEALALGVPALASDCPYGPREILRPGTDHLPAGTTVVEPGEGGLLLPRLSGGSPATLDTWRGALLAVTSPGPTREELVAAALRRASEFDGDHFVASWERVLERASADGTQRG